MKHRKHRGFGLTKKEVDEAVVETNNLVRRSARHLEFARDSLAESDCLRAFRGFGYAIEDFGEAAGHHQRQKFGMGFYAYAADLRREIVAFDENFVSKCLKSEE